MKSAPALLAAFFSALVLAVVATGFQAKQVKRVMPCSGDCIPRAELVKSQKRSYHRLLGWRAMERDRNRWKARSRVTWHPTFEYAVRLASAVFGVPAWQLRSVAICESTLFPFAQNGRYKGYWQLGWSPFGFSPFDPVASALSTAQTVRHDGSWRQWVCKP